MLSFLLYFFLTFLFIFILLPAIALALLMCTNVGRSMGILQLVKFFKGKFRDTYNHYSHTFERGEFNFKDFDFNAFTQGGTGAPSSSNGRMSRAECLKILDLEEGANKREINAAYKRLIQQCHPDKGGSTYLTKKINEARDILLGKRS